MKCLIANCDGKVTHILTQKQGRRTKPCSPLRLCKLHTPEWAVKLGTGETRYYTVRAL